MLGAQQNDRTSNQEQQSSTNRHALPPQEGGYSTTYDALSTCFCSISSSTSVSSRCLKCIAPILTPLPMRRSLEWIAQVASTLVDRCLRAQRNMLFIIQRWMMGFEAFRRLSVAFCNRESGREAADGKQEILRQHLQSSRHSHASVEWSWPIDYTADHTERVGPAHLRKPIRHALISVRRVCR